MLTHIHKICNIVLITILLLPVSSFAQVKVVIIPLGEDTKPLEPLAPVALINPDGLNEFTSSSNWNIFTDFITGLVWQKQAPPSRNWPGAVAYCSDLNIGPPSTTWGPLRNDWRLPTVTELMSLIDYTHAISISHTSDDMGSIAIEPAEAGEYWTSTAAAIIPDRAWTVDSHTGMTTTTAATTTNHVRCVRSGRPAGPLFKENNDNTVTDLGSGLTWQQQGASQNQVLPQANAVSYCNDLNLANHNDWRLPNVKELASIVNYQITTPALYTDLFEKDILSNLLPSNYWTTTVDANDSNDAWVIHTHSGKASITHKIYPYGTRCVR